ncbi:MAG: hypothetical protein MUF84_16935 [Anaerolineae bacterium]|jgi:hypothetical protein|nr:hypothetical protein [Anaerolineae bacterium]
MAALTANGEVGPRITLWLDDLETATLRRAKLGHMMYGGWLKELVR